MTAAVRRSGPAPGRLRRDTIRVRFLVVGAGVKAAA